MKHYTDQETHWKESMALGFFLNFIKNHNRSVNNNDTFNIVAELRTHEQWVTLIKKTFPATTIEKMRNNQEHNNRLDFTDAPQEMIREIWNTEYSRNKMRNLLSEVVKEELLKNPPGNYVHETFAKKVAELQMTLKLNDRETNILLVFAFIQNNLLSFDDRHHRRTDEHDKAVFVAKSLDCQLSDVMTILDEKNKLRRYQCLDNELDFNGSLFDFLNGFTEEPLTKMYFTRNKEKVLPWNFYGTIAEKHGTLIERLISCCDGTNSANILLYGAPGTGKSSFAKTLAERLHRTCYMINQDAAGGGRSYSDPNFRFGALQVCAEQVEPTDSLIVIDESDDMLRGGGAGSFLSMLFGGNLSVGDKGRLNSVLDNIKIPTIWITNTPAEALDESSRRRFDYSIRFDPLNDTQRKMIWRNNIAKMNLESLVSEAMQTKFSSLYPVSAGGITMVLQNVAKLNPKQEEVESLVEKLMKPHCELLGLATQRNKILPAKDYSLDGLNIKGKIPLKQIVEAIRNYQSGNTDEVDRPRMNLLLSGAPGTGKTEFVKYLGAELNTKVIVKMGSDLLNMYVGGTEQQIKSAFEEAESEHAILFLDEIDGMLQSREHAHQSWEVTQVNELLHQMENFNGIMIGATNFSANLDPAVLRRFTFKLEFDYLDEVGKRLFFERMFQTKLTVEEERKLAAITHLAPGDFRTVRQSFFYLGGNISNNDRIEALRHESECKRDSQHSGKKDRIGF